MRLRWSCILALVLIVAAAQGTTPAAGQPTSPPPGMKSQFKPKVVADLDSLQLTTELVRSRRLLRNREMFLGLRKRHSPKDFGDLFQRNGLKPLPFPEIEVLKRDIGVIKEYIEDLEAHPAYRRMMSITGSRLMAVYETAPPTQADEDRRPFVPMDDKTTRDAANAVVAIISREAFTANSDSTEFTITEPTEISSPYDSQIEFCEDVEFNRTMSVKHDHFRGTGFLIEYETDLESIDEDTPVLEGNLIVTAGHVTATDFLDEVYFVFGFRLNGDGSLRTEYTDKEVRKGTWFVRHPEQDDDNRDFAIIKLRESNHDAELEPLPFRNSGRVPAGTSVYMIGHPQGMPQMATLPKTIEDGQSCLAFDAPLESYDLNSGSPVISLAGGSVGMVEGILKDSPRDFERHCDCSVITTTADSDTDKTTIVRVTQVAGWLERGEKIKITNDTEVMVEVNSFHELGPGESKVIDYTPNLWVDPIIEMDFAAVEAAEVEETPLTELTPGDCDNAWDAVPGSAWRVVVVEGRFHMDECPAGTISSEI